MEAVVIGSPYAVEGAIARRLPESSSFVQFNMKANARRVSAKASFYRR
jgi:hypothetical protein